MSKKMLKTYEKERGMVFTGDVDLSQKLNDDEFAEFMQTNPFVGVHHDERAEWLKANGYEVTRENLIDGSLSASSENSNSEEN